MRLLIVAAAAGALVATGGASAKEKKPEDPDKKICKFEGDSTSRIAKKTCKTRAEWDALKAQRQEGGVDSTYRPIEQRN